MEEWELKGIVVSIERGLRGWIGPWVVTPSYFSCT
jgi:hypothetical protein